CARKRKACGGGTMDAGSLVVAVLGVGAGLATAVLAVATVWFVRGWRFRILRYRLRRLMRRDRPGTALRSRWQRA
ncbi:MAG: hypothetical protein AB1503_13110, partial [Bacillota bacterium]